MKRIVAAFSSGFLLLNFVLMSASSAFAQGDPPGFEPISIYSLDNGKVDDSVPDASKKTPDGQANGNPQTTADRFGNPNGAMLFDGVDDYIQTNEDSNIKPLTFSLWFRADDISGEHSLVDSDESGKYGHSLIIGYDDPNNQNDIARDGSLDVQYHNGFWDTGRKIEPGKWYHAFVTYGDTMQLYLGTENEPMKLIAEQPYPTASGFDGSKFRFGRHNAGDPQWFKGAIDDVRFYDKALPKEVIEQIPVATPTPSAPLIDKCVNIPVNSFGDVHIKTPDLLAYDFQESGEFILTRSTSGNVVVQARQEVSPTNRNVTINTAAAILVGRDKLEFYMKPQFSFLVNGAPTALPASNLDLPGGGRIIPCKENGRFVIAWPDGNTAARVIVDGTRSLDIGVTRLNGTLTYEGLIGNLDKDLKNDVQIRGETTPLPLAFTKDHKPVAAADFKKFGDSWRVAAGESLFSKPIAMNESDTANESHMFFAMSLSSPASQAEGDQLTLNDLEPQAIQKAVEVCKEVAVDGGFALYTCTYDVAATGDESFAQSSAVVNEDIKAEPAAADLLAPPAMLEPETVIAAAVAEATAAPAAEAPTAEAPAAEATEVPATAVAQAATAAPPAEATAAPAAPATVNEAPASTSGLFSNPLVLLVIGVVVVALAAFALMRRR